MLFQRMLPYYASGKIVVGFGRGSTQLGFPTANFEEAVVDKLPAEFECGIYCGWASVDNGPVYKMVMSVGFNPFYNNTKKTMETHILHTFGTQLHDQLLKVCILNYIRPETNFNSLDKLKDAIQNDIKIAEAMLDSPEFNEYSKDSFFSV